MKTIKKSIKEDKIIAKEDEGGIPMGGDIGGSGEITPPSINGGQSDHPHPFTNDVIPTVPMSKKDKKHNSSVKIDDVLGVNPVKDKNCTGFFANGSFHVPFPVFTVPSYRLNKKTKKNKPKLIDLTEKDDYDNFLIYCKNLLVDIFKEAEKDMKKIDPEISIVFDEDYKFEDYKADWVAALNKENQEDIKTFIVGFNFRILYNYLYEQGLEMDSKEIECQLKASLYHELGHAILQYFEDTELMDFELSQDEEEKMVEEYAKFKLKEYTNVKSSKLQNFIDEVVDSHNKEKLEETNAHDTDIEKDSPPTFTVPINIDNRRIIPNTQKQKIEDGIIGTNQIGKKFTIAPDENILVDKEGNSIFGEVTFLITRGMKGVPGIVKIQNQEKVNYFIPTLIDIVRLSHDKIQTLPLSFLNMIDNMDNSRGYNSFNVESVYDDIENSKHLKDERYERYKAILNLYTRETISQSVLYSFVVEKRSGGDNRFVQSMGVILKEGVYLAYVGKTTAQGIQTAYFIEPCEIIATLSKCTNLHTYNGADSSNISTELLWNSLQNILEKKTQSAKGSSERKQSQNRRYIEKTDVK